MAISLTTVARVRQRLALETWESTDTAITQFITDSEATITNYMGSLPTAARAGSIATSMAAYYTGISLPPLQNKEAEKARLTHIREFKTAADRDLLHLLVSPADVPLPKSTTE